MTKKLEVYSPIKEEVGVIMIFTKMHNELGFPKLVMSSARGFDIDSIEYKGRDVILEFEYNSRNFISHGHVEKMEDDKAYVVVCWNDDCNLKKTLKDDYGKKLYEVIELRDYVTIKDNNIEEKKEEIKYIILNYNPKFADNRAFSEWNNSNLYRLNSKFADDHIPRGSKVLIKQDNYIVGGFDVVRYERIKKPTSQYEWNLYKSLTDYPVSMFINDINEMKNDFTEGHIFYDNFFVIEKAKLPFNLLLPQRNMSNNGKIYIAEEEYYNLVK
jgi:hypothetical protein